MEDHIQEDSETLNTNQMETKKTLLVIPYLMSGAQGGELETSVNGWIRHFMGSLEIVVIGDRSPVAAKLEKEGKAKVIELGRKMEHAGEPALDIARKIAHVISLYAPYHKGCIWTNDDIYPVNSIRMHDITMLKWVGDNLSGDVRSDNYFRRSMARTRKALVDDGKPIRNYSSHCPKWYDFSRMSEVFRHFGCETNPHLIESLYFNYWYPGRAVRVNVNRPHNGIKLGLYRSGYDLGEVESALRDVKFVNHSREGYSLDLIRLVRRHNNQ